MYNEHILFEFDAEKEEQNIRKHGVDFKTAQQVFYNPQVMMAPDSNHSSVELRWYAVGRIGDGRIITVWFTQRNEKIRIIGAGELRKWREQYEKGKIAGSE